MGRLGSHAALTAIRAYEVSLAWRHFLHQLGLPLRRVQSSKHAHTCTRRAWAEEMKGTNYVLCV
jgi:hypothetical protein